MHSIGLDPPDIDNSIGDDQNNNINLNDTSNNMILPKKRIIKKKIKMTKLSRAKSSTSPHKRLLSPNSNNTKIYSQNSTTNFTHIRPK